MKRVPVKSSTIAEVGYDPNITTLEVEFKNRTVYQYFNVPPTIHIALMAAPSVGHYFDVNIKKAGYAFKKISG